MLHSQKPVNLQTLTKQTPNSLSPTIQSVPFSFKSSLHTSTAQNVFPRNGSPTAFFGAEDCCRRERDAHDGWYLQPVRTPFYLPMTRGVGILLLISEKIKQSSELLPEEVYSFRLPRGRAQQGRVCLPWPMHRQVSRHVYEGQRDHAAAGSGPRSWPAERWRHVLSFLRRDKGWWSWFFLQSLCFLYEYRMGTTGWCLRGALAREFKRFFSEMESGIRDAWLYNTPV